MVLFFLHEGKEIFYHLREAIAMATRNVDVDDSKHQHQPLKNTFIFLLFSTNSPSFSISCHPIIVYLFFSGSLSGSESWSTWNCLQNCLKSGCRSSFHESEKTEISFLKRCVSMVIQRLARSSEPWTVDTLRGTTFFSTIKPSLYFLLFLYI